MAWNQQPGDNKPKDPWGRDDKSKGDGNKSQSPELDKVFKDIKQQFSVLFGGGKPSGNRPKSPLWPLPRLLALLLLGLVGVFVFSGFYQVPSGQKAVVLLYGQVNRVTDPGLHWYNPLLESLHLVDIATDSHYRLTGELATADGQLIKVGVDVGYKVDDAANYVLATAEPVTLLQNLTLAELRQLMGRNSLADLLAKPTSQWATRLQQALQAALAPWHAGLEVTSLDLTSLALPDAVAQAAAGSDKASAKVATDLQDAKDYQQSQLLAAQAQAERLLIDARAYQQKVVDQAEGETARFNSLLATYTKAPQVTRDRLYLETMEEVLGKTSKVVVLDSKAGQQLNLPLAELVRSAPAKPTSDPAADEELTPKKPATGKAAPATAVPSLYGEPRAKQGETP